MMIIDWNSLVKNHGVAIVCGIFLMILLALQSTHKAEKTGIDTFIPQGYVLIPIEVTNKSALNHFSSQHFKADIFAGKTKVFSQVRVLRAPKNPDVYAILVHESRSDQLILNDGPFRVMIHHPKHRSMKSKRKIIYGKGS